MRDFSRLRIDWLTWTAWAGMWNPSVTVDDGKEDAVFTSDDQTYRLRHEDDWWVLDVTNDRRKLYPAVGKFSSFELAEKYLIWNWATLIRSSLASGTLGAELYKLGYSPSAEVNELREGFVEIRGNAGIAELPTVRATIFSHLMAMPVEEIEGLVDIGMPSTAPRTQEQ